MDTANNLPKSAHLLDDLESIRKLLGDDMLHPPLLTDTVVSDEQIPLLFDQLEAQQKAEAQAVAAAAPVPATPAQNRQDTLLHLDAELRAAAQLIMQDVIDDFAPHIETEIKRRLEARMERLLQQS